MAYCPINLAGIASSCETSMGGLKKVYIATYSDNIYTVDSTAHTISGISTGTTWYEYNFKKGVCSMTSTLNVDNANGVNYVTTELVLQFLKMDTAKRVEVGALCTGDIAVIAQDANGKYWALGMTEPVNASAGTAQTGQAKTDGNFYQITLTDDNPEFPYEVTKAAIDTLVIG